MPVLPTFKNLLVSHTFGRNHSEPPPLPQGLQVAAAQEVAVLSDGGASSMPAHDVLPHDFDHLVRSVGEW